MTVLLINLAVADLMVILTSKDSAAQRCDLLVETEITFIYVSIVNRWREYPQLKINF